MCSMDVINKRINATQGAKESSCVVSKMRNLIEKSS